MKRAPRPPTTGDAAPDRGPAPDGGPAPRTSWLGALRCRIEDLRLRAASAAATLSDKEEYAANRRAILGDNYFFNIAINLAGGGFLTGYLLRLGADDAFLGLVTMATLLGNSLQVLSPVLLNRFPRRRPILIATRAVFLLITIVLVGAAQFLPVPHAVQLSSILAATLVANGLAALISPGIFVWHIRSIPETMRVRFFSFLNISVNVLMYGAILIGSRAVDVFKGQGQELLGLTVLRGAAVVFAVLDLLAMARIREYPEPAAPSGLKVLLAPFRSPKYLATVGLACIWSFGANLTGPYFTAYLLQDVGIAYTVLNLVAAGGVVVMLLATPAWTRRIERWDLRRAFRLCLMLYSVHYFAISFTTKGSLWLYPAISAYAYLVVAGMAIVVSNLPFLGLPEEDRTTSIAFYAGVNSAAALVGVLVGREFVRRTEGVRLDLLGLSVGNRQMVLWIAGGTMLVASLLLTAFGSGRRNRRKDGAPATAPAREEPPASGAAAG
jgi:MFS family permease